MSQFRSLLEKKLDETYISKRESHEDILVSPEMYQFNMGFLQALRTVGFLIKETAREIYGDSSA